MEQVQKVENQCYVMSTSMRFVRRACVRRCMIYGSEVCTCTARKEGKLVKTEKRVVRIRCGQTVYD
jgi:hypothetical protein